MLCCGSNVGIVVPYSSSNSSSADPPSSEDLRIYYDNHLDIFSAATKFHTIKYESKNRRLLHLSKQNLMANFKEVQKSDVVYEVANLSNQLRYIFNETKKSSFTQIIALENSFAMFYMMEKENLQISKFDEVKDKIFQILMNEKQKRYLEEFFENLKLNADIRTIR